MRKLKNKLLISFFGSFMLLSSVNLSAQGSCVANDPGECVRNCSNGLGCCVGTSPNCSGGWSTEEQSQWIDCGNGKEYCSTIPT